MATSSDHTETRPRLYRVGFADSANAVDEDSTPTATSNIANRSPGLRRSTSRPTPTGTRTITACTKADSAWSPGDGLDRMTATAMAVAATAAATMMDGAIPDCGAPVAGSARPCIASSNLTRRTGDVTSPSGDR